MSDNQCRIQQFFRIASAFRITKDPDLAQALRDLLELTKHPRLVERIREIVGPLDDKIRGAG